MGGDFPWSWLLTRIKRIKQEEHGCYSFCFLAVNVICSASLLLPPSLQGYNWIYPQTVYQNKLFLPKLFLAGFDHSNEKDNEYSCLTHLFSSQLQEFSSWAMSFVYQTTVKFCFLSQWNQHCPIYCQKCLCILGLNHELPGGCCILICILTSHLVNSNILWCLTRGDISLHCCPYPGRLSFIWYILHISFHF